MGEIMFKYLVSVFVALVLLSACSIHPLPEDVAGVDTYHIVRQIRCETRESIRTLIVTWLDDLAKDREGRPGDPIARKLALQYESDPESIAKFSPDLFPGPRYVEVRRLINLFREAGIAYTFELTMTENNDFDTDISLLRPLTQPKFTLGIKAGAKRQRTNNRVFTVTDTFSHLLTKLNTQVRGQHYCDGQIVQANYFYPIAGRVGIDKVVTSFIELTLFANLAGSLPKPVGAAPTMAEKLTFTTTIDASATPRVEFSPLGRDFQLANASLTGAVKRLDVHQVTVGIAIATGDAVNLDPLRSFLFSSQRGARVAGAPENVRQKSVTSSLVVGRRVTGGGTPSEVLAVLAIDQLKSRELEIVSVQ
jgi:hypothetical protein